MLREPLECMLSVAKFNSFARAAKEMYMSTPAITQRMNALEDELGFKLFLRNNKGAFLTAAGETFAAEAERLLTDLDETVERCRAISEKVDNQLNIGVSGTLNHYLLPKICENFRKLNPDVRLSFVEVKDATGALLQGLVDINITYGNVGLAFPQIYNTTICNDDCVCLLWENHRLAGRESICLEDIIKEKMVTPALEFSDYHRKLCSILKDKNPSIQIDIMDSINVGKLKSVTADYISFCPRTYHVEEGNIISIPFATYPQISIDALTREEPKGIVLEFIQVARETVLKIKKYSNELE